MITQLSIMYLPSAYSRAVIPASLLVIPASLLVIPAKAGIHCGQTTVFLKDITGLKAMDPRLHGDDDPMGRFNILRGLR